MLYLPLRKENEKISFNDWLKLFCNNAEKNVNILYLCIRHIVIYFFYLILSSFVLLLLFSEAMEIWTITWWIQRVSTLAPSPIHKFDNLSDPSAEFWSRPIRIWTGPTLAFRPGTDSGSPNRASYNYAGYERRYHVSPRFAVQSGRSGRTEKFHRVVRSMKTFEKKNKYKKLDNQPKRCV